MPWAGPGTTSPRARRSAPKPSLRSPPFRWTSLGWAARIRRIRFSWAAFRSGIGPFEAPQIPSERRSLLTDWSRYPGRGLAGGAFPRSPLDPPACNGHSVPAYLFGPRRSRSIVAAQPFAFLTVRDGFGVAPNSAPDKGARLSVARPLGRVGRPCGRWAGWVSVGVA